MSTELKPHETFLGIVMAMLIFFGGFAFGEYRAKHVCPCPCDCIKHGPCTCE